MTKIQVNQVWATWSIVWRGVWDSDMAGVLVADEMGIGKMITVVALAIICQLLTEEGVVQVRLSILYCNTLDEWLNMAQDNCLGSIGEEREWYPVQRLNSVPCCLLEIQTTPALRHPVLTSALESIIVVKVPRVATTFKSANNEMEHGTDFS
jgi:hypothetical protein